MDDAKEVRLRAFIAEQFVLANEAQTPEGEAIADTVIISEDSQPYFTFEFNTALHVAGEGDFRLTIREDEKGNFEVVDYQAGEF